jgi:hypothetical protein
MIAGGALDGRYLPGSEGAAGLSSRQHVHLKFATKWQKTHSPMAIHGYNIGARRGRWLRLPGLIVVQPMPMTVA